MSDLTPTSDKPGQFEIPDDHYFALLKDVPIGYEFRPGVGEMWLRCHAAPTYAVGSFVEVRPPGSAGPLRVMDPRDVK